MVEFYLADALQVSVLVQGVLLSIIGGLLLKAVKMVCCIMEVWRMQCEQCEQYTHEVQQSMEIIEVDSSPEPTRTTCSPFWQTTPSPRRRRARRAGRQRLASHTRKSTRTYNPKLPHHCAYQCLLKVAGLSVKPAKVMELRSSTADALYVAYTESQVLYGIDARETVQASGHTLRAYMADIRHQQWASALEVALAANILDISLFIMDGQQMIKIGNKPAFAIRLCASHWTLMKMHKVSPTDAPDEDVDMLRGGMWTWEDTTPCTQEDEEVPEWARMPSVSQPSSARAPPGLGQEHQRGGEGLHHEPPKPPKPPQPLLFLPVHESGESPSKIMHINVDPMVETDIKAIEIEVKCGVPLGVILDRVAGLLQVQRMRLAMKKGPVAADFLSLWEPCPDHAYLVDIMKQPSPMGKTLLVELAGTDITFNMCIAGEWTHADVYQRLSMIFAAHPGSLMCVTPEGHPWTYPHTGSNNHVIVKSTTLRGGIRTDDSAVSSTLPMDDDVLPEGEHLTPITMEDPPQADVDAQDYDNGQDYDPAHDLDMEVWHREEVMAEPTPRHPTSASRSRSPSRPRRSIIQHQQFDDSLDPAIDHDESTYWSGVWPISPPPAQPDRIARPVYVEDQLYGHIYAAPGADVTEVLDEFVLRVRPLSMVEINPIQAIQWRHVTFLAIDLPPQPRTRHTYDMRMNGWERLQRIRLVPVILNGELIDTLIFPWHLSLQQAQFRIDEVVSDEEYWSLGAVSYDNWVVVGAYLPPSLREHLQELEDLRAERRLRGGMPRKLWQIEAGFENDSEYVICENPRIQCCYAHSPNDTFDYWVGEPGGVMADVVCYFADLHQVSTDDVIIATWGRQPMLEDSLDDYLWQKFYIILLKDLHVHDYKGKWVWSHEDIYSMAKQQRGERHLPPVKRHVFLPTPMGMPVALSPERGGARNSRMPQMTPEAFQKQQMATWAHTKCHEACPTVDSKLIKTLLREARMVSAVLHARSHVQVVHVVVAALKRAGLTPMAVELERRHGIEGEVETDEAQTEEHAHDQRPQGQQPQSEAQPPVMVQNVHTEYANAGHQHVQDEMRDTARYLQDMHHKINQMITLHQYQYVAAMRYDLTPVSQQIMSVHNEIITYLQHVHSAMGAFENRLSMWETTYLPAIFDRLQEIQPVDALPRHGAEHEEEGQQAGEQERHSQDTQTEDLILTPLPQRTEREMQTERRVPTIVEMLQSRSATANPSNASSRRALHPFQVAH